MNRSTINRPAEAARNYLASGWRTVPIRPGQKAANISGWPSLRLTDDEIPARFGDGWNVGLILGEASGWLVCVDLDCPEATELADTFLPHTDAVCGRASTPGAHRFYIVEGAETQRFNDPEGDEKKPRMLELLSTGTQVLVWPSIHPSGEAYEMMPGPPATVDADTLRAAVEKLHLAVLRERHGADYEPKPKPAPAVVDPRRSGPIRPRRVEREEALRRASAYVERMPPSIGGQGGHNAAFAAACRVAHGFALDEDGAYAILREFNGRCEPAWSEKELRHKAAQAATVATHKHPRGYLLDADRPGWTPRPIRHDTNGAAPVGPVEDDAPTLELAPWYVAGDLCKTYPKKRPVIVEGLLRRGESLNAIGPTKVGKTWLIMALIRSLLTGEDWLGRFSVPRPCRVLLVDLELHAEELASRVRAVMDPAGLDLHTLPLRGRRADVHMLRWYFKAMREAGLEFDVVCLDALYRLLPEGVSENDNAQMASVYNTLDGYAREMDAAFVLVHHSSKGTQGEKSVTDVGSGAGSIARATDSHIVFRPHQEEGVMVLDAAVRSFPPVEPICAEFVWPHWRPVVGYDPKALAGSRRARCADMTCEEFVAEYIGDEPRKREDIEAHARAFMSEHRFKEMLSAAKKAGMIHSSLQGGSARDPLWFSTQPFDEGGK